MEAIALSCRPEVRFSGLGCNPSDLSRTYGDQSGIGKGHATMRLERRLRGTRVAGLLWSLLWAGSAEFGGAQTLGRSVQMRDVPFQATQVVTRETQAGTMVTRGRMARDGAGSTYVEMVDPRTGVATTAFLLDVPGRRGVVLDLLHKRYSVRPAPELRSREPMLGAAPELLESAAQSTGRTEIELCDGSPCTLTHLGTKLIGGLMSVGSSEVWLGSAGVLPKRAGEASAVTRETERWFSVELGVLVRMTELDRSRQQKTEVGLTEILRTEPNPALFVIPRDFRPDGSSAGRPAGQAPGEPADGE